MNLKNLALASLFLIVACAPGSVRLTRLDISPTYDPGEFAFVAAGRDLHVEIVGNPFGGDQAAFEAAVTDAMQGRHWGQRTNFTTTPGEDARLTHRVVFLFDPLPSQNGSRLCRGEATDLRTERVAGEIALFGAFCREETARSRIRGHIAAATGPEDPAFRELVGQVTRSLFPPNRGRNRGGGCPPGLIC